MCVLVDCNALIFQRGFSTSVLSFILVTGCYCNSSSFHNRFGLARYESIMELRNELENLGRIKGANKDEKG